MAALADEDHDKAVGAVKRLQPGQKQDPVKPISEAEAVRKAPQKLPAGSGVPHDVPYLLGLLCLMLLPLVVLGLPYGVLSRMFSEAR